MYQGEGVSVLETCKSMLKNLKDYELLLSSNVFITCLLEYIMLCVASFPILFLVSKFQIIIVNKLSFISSFLLWSVTESVLL